MRIGGRGIGFNDITEQSATKGTFFVSEDVVCDGIAVIVNHDAVEQCGIGFKKTVACRGDGVAFVVGRVDKIDIVTSGCVGATMRCVVDFAEQYLSGSVGVSGGVIVTDGVFVCHLVAVGVNNTGKTPFDNVSGSIFEA